MAASARGRLRHSKLAGVVAFAAVAVVAAGCGSSDESTSTEASASVAETTTATVAPTGKPEVSNEIDVSLTEYAIAPSNVLPDDGEGGPPTSKAEPGKVTFTITNDGDYMHSFAFNNGGKVTKIPEDLAPGETTTLTVDVPSTGYYEYYCPLPRHQGYGMQAQLQVD